MSARPSPARKRRDVGRALAVLLCVLFALVGAVPLLLGVLVRTSFVRGWVAAETTTLLTRELGISARYSVEVEAWPMMVALSNVTVDASDGGLPFLRVERIAARPRPFSLLAGRLDVGEVEIDRPWIRAVLTDGKLANLAYQLPQSDSQASRALPFTSLAITEARVDLTVDGARILTEEIDADVAAEDGGAIEAALRASGATITRTHPMPDYPSEDAVDEDRICKLEVRARVDGDEILVRRLQVAGSLDFDPDAGTLPACALPRGDWRAFDLSLSAVHVFGLTIPGAKPRASGRVRVKAPPAIVHRFAKAPHLTGSVILDADVEYDGGRLPSSPAPSRPTTRAPTERSSPRPSARSSASPRAPSASTRSTPSGAAERSPSPRPRWSPSTSRRALHAGPVEIHGIDFPDLIRDLGVHPQATVGWTLSEAHMPEFSGTLDPLKLDGALTVQTEDFQVFDRSARRPGKRRMIGLPEALVKGNFGIRAEGVLFQGFTVDSPRTHLETTVLIEFKNRISLDVQEGSTVDLSEVGPLVDIPIAGIAKVKANMRGPLTKPKLLGDVSISDFVFGGLPVGQIESAKAEFEPLVLTMTDVHIRKYTPENGPKGPYSRIRSRRARFAFDEGPTVIVDAEVDTEEGPHADIQDLLDIFNMDETTWKRPDRKDPETVKDPRWTEIRGRAAGNARIRFVLGGPEDRCGGGILRVGGDFALQGASLYGERYPKGDVAFSMVWDDRKAGVNGMNLDVHSAILRKGEGTIAASATIRHGGVLRAQAVASGIPIGSLDVLGEWGKKFDGTASAVARIGGKLDAITGRVDVEISRVGVWPSTLPPSHLTVDIVPRSATARAPAPAPSSAAAPVSASAPAPDAAPASPRSSPPATTPRAPPSNTRPSSRTAPRATTS